MSVASICKFVFAGLVLVSGTSFGQVLYNSQQFYDSPGGLYDQDSLRTLNIDFYDPNFHQILVEGWETQSGIRLPAKISLSNGEVLDSVAVRYKGNSTFYIANENNNPKLPLNLDFNDIVSGQKLMNYKKVKLANSLFDPTFCKEVVAYSIYKKYLPSSQANFMRVNLGGEYLGLYVNTQAVDKQFLEQHFGENDGVLFKCDPNAQFGQAEEEELATSYLEWLGNDSSLYYQHYSLKSDYGWSELMELIDAINSPQNPIDSILNVDRVLWAFAVNTVLLNLDSYNGLFQHNYYLYQTGDGLFQMIPWDLTESFVGALLNYNSDITELYEYNPYNGYNSALRPLCHQLTSNSANPLYRKIYTAHIRTVLEESLDYNAISNMVSELQSLIAAAAFSDQNQQHGTGQFYANVDAPFIIPNEFSTAGILPSVSARESYLASLPEIAAAPPFISSHNVENIGSMAYVSSQVSNATKVELMATISSYNSKFQSVEMLDDGTNGDQISGDGVFTAPLPFNTNQGDIKYYIRAQNADALILDPEHAEYEFYVYNGTVNVEDSPNNQFKVYPNPTSSILTIESMGLDSKEYEIISMLGKMLLSGKTNAVKHNIDLGILESGIYILKIDNQSIQVFKSDDY